VEVSGESTLTNVIRRNFITEPEEKSRRARFDETNVETAQKGENKHRLEGATEGEKKGRDKNKR